MSVIVGELTEERVLQTLGGEMAHITYSDPPWGPGNLMYWRTHNKETTRPNWDVFLDTFCRLVSKYTDRDGHVLVEMGLRWVDQLAAAMAKYDRIETQRFNCFYTSKKLPNVLWYSGPGITTDPSGLSGVAMTKTALSGVVKPGALVLDPCCGKGMTARCSIGLGMRFAGVELNPNRAKVTQAWLERSQKSRKKS